jgi:hypothetical protein
MLDDGLCLARRSCRQHPHPQDECDECECDENHNRLRRRRRNKKDRMTKTVEEDGRVRPPPPVAEIVVRRSASTSSPYSDGDDCGEGRNVVDWGLLFQSTSSIHIYMCALHFLPFVPLSQQETETQFVCDSFPSLLLIFSLPLWCTLTIVPKKSLTPGLRRPCTVHFSRSTRPCCLGGPNVSHLLLPRSCRNRWIACWCGS